MNRTALCAAAVLVAPCAAFLALSASGAQDFGQRERPCPIVPTPKVYRATGKDCELAASAVIVVGSQATEPEKYAGERLQTLVRRRFGRTLRVVTEKAVPDDAKQLLLLGQPATHGKLRALCKTHKIDTAEIAKKSESHDGFAIEVGKDGATVLVAGSNPRGVIYGADAFFDLLRKEGDKIVFPTVRVRDWPSIAWRGRPNSRPETQLVPGTFDAYVRSRLNWIDLRDGPTRRRGVFGYPPGAKINKPQARKIVEEAHRRGFFIYATVQCSVRGSQFGGVLKTFKELIDLGADGLWISYDDPGGGSAAPGLIARVLELGKEHGMTGRKIAVVPPSGSYQVIETDWNRAAVAVKGFEEATWLFTRVPAAGDVAAAKRLGLRRLPGWWHNWPRIKTGFLHGSYGGGSLRKDRKPAYLEVTPLQVGWHKPTYAKLRNGHQCTGTIMMWGGHVEEYTCGALGLWGWDPARHDWQRTREAIYRYVFGPGQAGAARSFDDALARLKRLFHSGVGDHRAAFLCVLNTTKSAPSAQKLIDTLDKTLRILEAGAPKETAIERPRLEKLFLEPMRATVEQARKVAALDPGLFAVSAFHRRMIALVEAGKLDEAKRLLEEKRKTVKPHLAAVNRALAAVRNGDKLGKEWEAALSSLDDWKQTVERERAERERERKAAAERRARHIRDMPNRFKRLMKRDYGKWLAKVDAPPRGDALAGLKAGDWKWQTDPPSWEGMFAIGRYERDGAAYVAVAFPGKTRSAPGDYAELRAAVKTPAFDGKLLLDAFITDTMHTTKWTGYRFVQLWVDDKKVWEEDIAVSREGEEWLTADITKAAKGSAMLKLRFRVEDRKGVGNYTTTTFLGPVRLRREP